MPGRDVPEWEATGQAVSGQAVSGREVPEWEVPDRAVFGRAVPEWEEPGRDVPVWDAPGWEPPGRGAPRYEPPGRGAFGREAAEWETAEWEGTASFGATSPGVASDRPAPFGAAPDEVVPDEVVPDWVGPDRADPAPAVPAPAVPDPAPAPAPVLEPAPEPFRGVGPEPVVDLVLDLVPGDTPEAGFGTTSASVSVPALPAAEGRPLVPLPADPTDQEVGAPPAPRPSPAREAVFDSLPVSGGEAPVPVAAAEPLRAAGRHQAVIASGRTSTIPVHLLFREDAAEAARAGSRTAPPEDPPADGPWWGGGEPPRPDAHRPPLPRGPQVRPSTRPAPAGDPCLAERPGPAIPGWLALFTALTGATGVGAVLWWNGTLPAGALVRFGLTPRPDHGVGLGAWAALAALASLVLFALGGLSRGRVGHAWVLTLFGEYRGSVRRTGLMWISPLLLRRRIDVRLRHWRSEPLPAVDANGTALRVVVLVVWRIDDTARAALGVADHEAYLREQVEAAMARVLSQLPADAFHEDTHTLRNAEAVGDALTRLLKADCEPVGIEVYSAQPTGIEYAPEVAAAMQRRRIAVLDAKHRDSVLTSVVDAVDDTVNRLTARGIVELDDYERKSLVKDLTVAFYTGRNGREGS
ncbi:SPFH domain-containing protein [Streptomyces sp. NPDC092952]|uniref:SPFH domain-containing protein n=1 Tax=Streptomyces sp. NPDC092952 TaxID=3366018 RepID=UPI00380134E9